MIRVLFICLGNICRSPLAQGIFEDHIKKNDLTDHFFVDSAATSSWHHGEQAHHSSIQIAHKYGIDISRQRSRPVISNDQQAFDYFIVMDENNKRRLLNEFGFQPERVFKIRDFDPNHKGHDVPDPYGQGIARFDYVYQILLNCTKPLTDFLLKKGKPG